MRKFFIWNVILFVACLTCHYQFYLTLQCYDGFNNYLVLFPCPRISSISDEVSSDEVRWLGSFPFLQQIFVLLTSTHSSSIMTTPISSALTVPEAGLIMLSILPFISTSILEYSNTRGEFTSVQSFMTRFSILQKPWRLSMTQFTKVRFFEFHTTVQSIFINTFCPISQKTGSQHICLTSDQIITQGVGFEDSPLRKIK